MRLVSLEQGSADWLVWRNKGLGSSDASHIMGGTRWSNPHALREQKLGRAVVLVNEAMAHGTRYEPEARRLFCDLSGLTFLPACVLHDQYDWLRASLDGLSEDRTTALEIKCPFRPENHARTVSSGEVPYYYVPQVQHQLLCTGLPRMIFVSYSPDARFDPADRLVAVPVEADPAYQQEYLVKAKEFWDSLS
jgi:putative phage-type endonuclease